MVPAGVKIAFDFGGTAGGWIPTTEDAVRADIIAELSGAYRVDNIRVDSVGAIYEMLEWEFTGSVEVTPLQGFANMEDARSIIIHAIYEATGFMPVVTAAGEGWTPTTASGILDSIGNFFKGITDRLDAIGQGAQDTTNLLLIGTAAVLIVVAVSAGGKTTRVGLG